MKPIIYSQSLNESFTPPLGAFKFAEQMIIYFKCQITFCNKLDNGCKKILPPNCNLTSLNSSSLININQFHSLQLVGNKNDLLNSQFNNNKNLTNFFYYSTNNSNLKNNYQTINNNNSIGNINNEWNSETINLFSRGKKQHLRRLKRNAPYFLQTLNNFDTNQTEFGFSQVQTEKINKLKQTLNKNFTIDVTADRVIIF